jgi:hypothetical protein
MKIPAAPVRRHSCSRILEVEASSLTVRAVLDAGPVPQNTTRIVAAEVIEEHVGFVGWKGAFVDKNSLTYLEGIIMNTAGETIVPRDGENNIVAAPAQQSVVAIAARDVGTAARTCAGDGCGCVVSDGRGFVESTGAVSAHEAYLDGFAGRFTSDADRRCHASSGFEHLNGGSESQFLGRHIQVPVLDGDVAPIPKPGFRFTDPPDRAWFFESFLCGGTNPVKIPAQLPDSAITP